MLNYEISVLTSKNSLWQRDGTKKKKKKLNIILLYNIIYLHHNILSYTVIKK